MFFLIPLCCPLRRSHMWTVESSDPANKTRPDWDSPQQVKLELAVGGRYTHTCRSTIFWLKLTKRIPSLISLPADRNGYRKDGPFYPRKPTRMLGRKDGTDGLIRKNGNFSIQKRKWKEFNLRKQSWHRRRARRKSVYTWASGRPTIWWIDQLIQWR